MQIKKRFMAPVLMIAAFFSGVSARAQQVAALPEAPMPQAGNFNVPQSGNANTPQVPLNLPDLSIQRHPLGGVDLSGLPYKTKAYDFSLPPDAGANNDAAPKLPGKVGRIAVFADRHMINGELGYDLAAEVRLKDKFTLVAGTPDTRYKVSDNRWENGGLNLKPEITIPGSWNTDTSHMSLRPKGRGFMIGLKVKFH